MFRVVQSNNLIVKPSLGFEIFAPYLKINPQSNVKPIDLSGQLMVGRSSIVPSVEPIQAAYNARVQGCDVWFNT